MRNYLRLWRIPGAPMLLVGGGLARLGHGVTIVAWVLLVDATGRGYTEAGLVAGAIALATAVAAPIAGRLTDRFAATRVVPAYAVAYAIAQVGLLTAVTARAPLPTLLVLSATAGAAFPPMSPAIRAAWTRLTGPDGPHADLRSTAMAAESAVFETVFVLGPLVLSLFSVIAAGVAESATPGIVLAIVFATVTTLAGSVVVCRGRAVQMLPGAAAGTRTAGLGPLRLPVFVLLLTVTAGVAFSFGASPVAIAAFAGQHDGASGGAVTGVLIAVWSVGSAAGGLAYGALPGATGTDVLFRRLVVVLLGLTVGYAAWQIAAGPVVLGVVLVVTGAVIAPATTVLAELVAETVPGSMLTEGYTWFTAVNMSCAALGSAVAGRLIDLPAGVSGAFWACAAAAGLGAAIAVVPAWRGGRAVVAQGV